MSADWVLTAAPGVRGEDEGDDGGYALDPVPARLAEEFEVDALEALEVAVLHASSHASAAKETRSWREVVVPNQGGVGNVLSSRSSARTASTLEQSRHLLALVGCCPVGELLDSFPTISATLLRLLRRGEADRTRAVTLAALDELLRRLLRSAKPGVAGAGAGAGANHRIGADVGGARQAVVSVLPKLVPAVTACLEGTRASTDLGEGDAPVSVPPAPAVAMAALGVLEALVFLLRSTMRPHVKRVEAVTALWLQGPDDVIRDRAAAVLASIPLCGEAEAWTHGAWRVTLEAHSLLQGVWPDDDVDMGHTDVGSSQLEAVLSARGGGLLPPLTGAAANGGDCSGFDGPQQAMAALVVRRFKGLSRVLELMLTGDSNGRAVSVPVPLVIALVERVQRISPMMKTQGPQAFIPVAQGALSQGALQVVRPALELAASRLLDALASTTAPTVLRHARRFCRALIQSMARRSAQPSLRAAGYRAVTRATRQLGPASTLHLAVPALPALLAEIRSIVTASDPVDRAGGGFVGAAATANGTSTSGGGGIAGVGKGGNAGMRIEPAMSARKSSQKKQRRSREKEVGRALAAADAAVTAAAGSSGLRLPSVNGSVGGARFGDSGGAAVWDDGGGLMEQAQRKAACDGLSCMTQLVLTCNAHLPLHSRLAVEDVLHRGLRVLARTSGKCGGGSGGGGAVSGLAGGGICSPLEDVRVVREFVTLTHACLVTPLADGARSGTLSVAVAALRSLRSNPDEGVALALAGCGALLYPRAAPLHLPHAITSQARAWGTSDGVISDSIELALGWGGLLRTPHGESDNDSGEGNDSDSDDDQAMTERRTDDNERHQQHQHQNHSNKAAPTLSVPTPPASNSKRSSISASLATPIAVVTPSSETNPQSNLLTLPGDSANTAPTLEANTSETSAAVTSRQRRDVISDVGLQVDSNAIVTVKGKGKGKGKGRDRAKKTYAESNADDRDGLTGGPHTGSSHAASGSLDEVDEIDATGDDVLDDTPRRKRSRNGAADTMKTVASVLVGEGKRRDDSERHRVVSVVTSEIAQGIEGRRTTAERDSEDDDDFEFPSIVDADPDE